VPTATQTETLTPDPTPVWAYIKANYGAIVRSKPSANATISGWLLDGSLVQVLPDTVQDGGTTWAHVITDQGVEGWVLQSILLTATPAPAW
jgi:hypothetical protein